MRVAITSVALALAILNPALAQEAEPTKESAKSEWRASKRGPAIELSESEDTILATVVMNRRYSVSYELKKRDDGTFKGFAAEEFSCRSDHFCRIETPVQATRVDENRIEGRIFGVTPPKGLRRGNLYCDTCGKSEEKNATWMDFVWVRDE